MKRYEQWHHTTLRGDRDRAQALVPLGRKLLGAIAEEMATMGTGQGKRTHRTPDGDVIVAQIIGAIPTLTITAPPRGARLTIEALDGFVVWPTGGEWAGGRAFPELVLDPKQGGDYHVFSFNGGELPTGLRTFNYNKVFPGVGLKHAGNVDWTNATETLSVSWYGPRSRYLEVPGMGIRFTYGHTRNRWVFCHGQELLDVQGAECAAVLGVGYALVAGAAIRKTPAGLVLLVVVTYDDTTDAVLAVDLVGTAKTPLITADLASVRLLGSRSWDVDEYDRYQHPFFFSPDASEARCIRDDAGRRVELVLSVGFDLDELPTSAAFTALYHPYPVLTNSFTLDSTVKNVIQVRQLDHADIDVTLGSPNNTYTVNSNLTITRPVYVDVGGFNTSQVALTSTMTGGVSASGDLVQAVDYRRDGTVVYLFSIPDTVTQSGSASGDYVFGANSATFTVHSISDGDAPSPGGNLNSPKASVSGAATADTAQSMTWSNASTTHHGLRFGDPLDVERLYVAECVDSYTETQTSAQTGVLSDAFTHGWDASFGAAPPGPGNGLPTHYGGVIRDGSDPTPSLALQAGPHCDAATIDRTMTLSGSCSYSKTSEALVFLYADLRNDCVVYIRERNIETISGFYSDSVHDTDLAHWLGTTKIHSIPASASLVRQRTLFVRQGLKALLEHAYTDSTVASTPTKSFDQRWAYAPAAGYFHNVGYTPRIDTLTPLPDTLFNTGGFSYALAGVFQGGGTEYLRTNVWTAYPDGDPYTAPPEDPLAQGDSSSSEPNQDVATLWGQIAVGTKIGWPLSDSPVDANGWRGYGAWAFYQDRYCFSCPAPGNNFGGGWVTVASTAKAQLLLQPHTTLHPIWVLPPVGPETLRPAKPGDAPTFPDPTQRP